jgi:hypothetical protein
VGCTSEDARRAVSLCRFWWESSFSPPVWDTSGDCDLAYHSDHTSSGCSCVRAPVRGQGGISPHRPQGHRKSYGCDRMPRNSHNASW